MKKIRLIVALAALVLAFGCEMGASSQSIAIVNNQNAYSFTAKYPKHKTDKVVAYLKNKLDGNKIFVDAQGEQIGDLILKDGSNFHYEMQAGYTKIAFKKRDNSEVNFKKLTALCMGIKKVLK